ncbi:MAG TPA: hypothetical protein V6C57_21300, partial [Coleofasciculaceae cyanobacterium]
VVHPQQRQGFLGKRREDADIIDVSQPYYFNLIRAALCALELAEKSQLLEIREQQLAEKDQQIAHLTQQLRLLNQPLNSNQLPSPLTAQVDQAPAIQIPIQPLEREAAIAADAAPRRSPTAPAKPEEIKRSLKAQLGESVWNRLSPSSQRDLTAAYKSLHAIQSEAFTAAVVDYSEAGLKLGLAIEREVVQLFFKQLYPFLQATGEPVIGGIALKARKKYTLAMLPPLLAAEWDALLAEALDSSSPLPESDRCYSVTTDQVSPRDRQILQDFLDQWQHPLAQWFKHHQTKAASIICQIGQLHHLSTQSAPFLHQWQFELLQSLAIGNLTESGILSAIYNNE